MIDPQQAFDMATSTLFVDPSPSKPKRPADTAFPTIIPDIPIFEKAGQTGERTLWVVFVLMVLASIFFVVLAWAVPASKRLYHHLTATVTIVSALAYFAMATHSGWTFHHSRIREQHDHVPDTFKHVIREVYWVRYVDWLITTPLLLLDLSLLGGLDGASTVTAITSSVVMVLSGLFSAFGHGRTQKWGWYVIAILAYLVVAYQVLFNGRRFANTRSSKVSKFFSTIAIYSLVVWLAYPVIWALAEGTRVLDVNQEIIAYAVLDILAKGVFGLWLLFTYRSLPESHVEVDGFWAHGFNSEGRIRVGDEDGA